MSGVHCFVAHPRDEYDVSIAPAQGEKLIGRRTSVLHSLDATKDSVRVNCGSPFASRPERMTPDGRSADICTPPLHSWPALLEHNLVARDRNDRGAAGGISLPSPEQRARIRRWMTEKAIEYTNHLNHLAVERGIDAPPVPVSDPTRPIVLTGHQPTIFWPGILAKLEAVAAFAGGAQALALCLILDIDRGDAAHFAFPEGADRTHVALSRVELGGGGPLFASQSVAPSTDLVETESKVARSLEKLGLEASMKSAHRAFELYRRLQWVKLYKANSIVRRALTDAGNTLELPLSTLVTCPELAGWFGSVVSDGAHFHREYNAALAAYRHARGIGNTANPFPDLQREGSRFELPFWVLDEHDRFPLFVAAIGDEVELWAAGAPLARVERARLAEVVQELSAGSRIVPRAVMLSIVMRFILSDLFCHGSGGAKYDRFTDLFVTRLWPDVTPPAYATVTAHRYLFEDERRRFLDRKLSAEQFRALVFHPEQIDREHLSERGLSSIETLAREREARRSEVKEAAARREPRKEQTHAVKRYDRLIEQVLREEWSERLDAGEELAHARRAWNCREYPFFFYEEYAGEKS